MVQRTKKLCSVDGCEKTARTRGWCSAHYARWLRHGDPLGGKHIQQICRIEGCESAHISRGFCQKHYRAWRLNQLEGEHRAAGAKTCSIEGCEARWYARDWCERHYRRWLDHSDPNYGDTWYSSPEDAFSARTEWQGNCLVWNGSKSNGYGYLQSNGKSVRVHRYAWEQLHGPIPDEVLVDHICHNKSCVNVEHLRLATKAENARNRSGADRRNKGSGIRNVYKKRNSWEVSVKKNNKHHSFGSYKSIEEASEVAERARKKLFGEFSGKG